MDHNPMTMGELGYETAKRNGNELREAQELIRQLRADVRVLARAIRGEAVIGGQTASDAVGGVAARNNDSYGPLQW